MAPSILKRSDNILLVALLSFFAPLTLYVFRAFDDNRLTSWQWVFDFVDVERVLFLVFLGLIVAYGLARASFYEGRPVVLFVFSFVAASLFWGEPEVIVDASRYVTQAKALAGHGIGFFLTQWGKAVFAWTDMPLAPFLYGLLFTYVGESRLVIQIGTTTLFAATVLLTYGTGKLLWDEELALDAALFLLGIPYLFTQVPLMLVDVPTMFFLMLAIFTCTAALLQGGWARCGAAGVAVFCAFYIKYSTWLMLLVLPIIFLCALRSEGRPAARRGTAIALVALVLIGFLALVQYDTMQEQLRFLNEYQGPGLRRWGEGFASTFLFQIHPFLSLAALFSLYRAWRRQDLNYAIVGLVVVLLVILQIRRIRYMLPAFPLLALMAAYGLRDMRDREVRRYLLFCVVNTSIIISLFAFLPFLQKMSAVNIKKAGEFLDSLPGQQVLVFALAQEQQVVNPAVSLPLLDLFTKKTITLGGDPAIVKDREAMRESSLRFTWEQPLPDIYRGNADRGRAEALVVIKSAVDQLLPEDLAAKVASYRYAKSFTEETGLFQYKTLVSVYFDEHSER